MKTERIICNECGTHTPHSVKTAETINQASEEGGSASYIHQILICASCSTGTYRHRFWFSEWQDPSQDGEPYYQDTYYPPRLNKRLPLWHDKLPSTLQDVMKETYAAHQHDLHYIASIGCRTALDIAIVEKIGDVGRFADKLTQLLSANHISVDEKDLLLAVFDSGDASAHRGFKPEPKDIVTMLDIVERLLHKFYIKPVEEAVLLAAARISRAKVPPRTPRSPV